MPVGTEDGEKSGKIFKLIIIAFVLITFLVACGLALFFIHSTRLKRKYKKSDLNAKLMLDFKIIILLADKFKMKIQDGETLLAYSKKVNDFIKTGTTSFSEVSEIYTKVRYGEKNISQKELDKVVEIKNFVQASVKRKIGKLKFSLFMLNKNI